MPSLERMKLKVFQVKWLLLLWLMLELISHFFRLSKTGKSCGCLTFNVQFVSACVFSLFQSTLRELVSVWYKLLLVTSSSQINYSTEVDDD